MQVNYRVVEVHKGIDITRIKLSVDKRLTNTFILLHNLFRIVRIKTKRDMNHKAKP